tara:strand:+ start:47 stop:319 length:273 start_codon:yes stop_codon:yes gene_type:complete
MKDNKLIAEFMELPIGHMEVVKEPFIYEHNGVWFCESELLYHTSWDWLMPVVNKIEIECEGVPPQLLDCSLYSEINEVYQAVVEFIKQYK